MSAGPDLQSRPSAVKIYVTTGAGVDIAWADGHQSHYDFAYLREKCPCAVCVDEQDRRAPLVGAALPLYKPRATARKASAVGHYAVQFDFTDGHSTGIYTYDYLREICPCAECRRGAEPAGG